MEYYSTTEMIELIYALACIILKNIMVSERSQMEKTTYCMIPFIRNVQRRQILRD